MSAYLLSGVVNSRTLITCIETLQTLTKSSYLALLRHPKKRLYNLRRIMSGFMLRTKETQAPLAQHVWLVLGNKIIERTPIIQICDGSMHFLGMRGYYYTLQRGLRVCFVAAISEQPGYGCPLAEGMKSQSTQPTPHPLWRVLQSRGKQKVFVTSGACRLITRRPFLQATYWQVTAP